MYAFNKVMKLLISIAIAMVLLTLNSVSALPTSEVAEIETRSALHPCSVFIQRWCQDCEERFDVAYYNVTWTTPWNWPIAAFWNQESDEVNVPTVGSELVAVQVGSNILHIIDTADPAPGDNNDPGKLSFVWGTDTWDSFSPGSPCDVGPVGTNAQYGGSTNYECEWLCDN
ncbi:uncharacterized protein LY89DRAFT_145362 [Mollisia scopiformis]|uniref:Uncharacterized protein n=1 Tax=Mollisia scopiformis TaxID=149040 RepID=A0A194X137_MOLSC|nr:uncharacterized protein LY89DRAFT_145362 [Mollisia scopiformis]KUJ13684.1 hypothetical protein LY89DRAFT_145362 [Mollisia scopiformis]